MRYLILQLVYSIVQQSGCMSGSNLGKNPTITYQQVNSQKTLIYDLRSELSNLKSEFSRLISKPAELATKSKVEYKPITKSRYSCLGSEADTQSHFSSVSELSSMSRTSQFPVKHMLNRSDSNHESKPVPVQQKFNINNKSFKTFDSTSATSKIMWSQQQKSTTQPKKLQSDSISSTLIRKPHEFASFYKKANDSQFQPDAKIGMTSRVSNKYEANHQDQQKIRKLELQNQQKQIVINESKKKIDTLQENVIQLKKQMQGMVDEQNRKNEKIGKLEDTVRQLTQKVGKSNEQTMEMGREKAKQIQIMRNGHLGELKNQQKDFERRMSVEKQNQDLKTQNLLKQCKQSYELKLKQAVADRNKMQEQIKSTIQKYQKQKAQVTQLNKKQQTIEISIKQKDTELGKKDSIIKQLQSKRTQTQNELKQIKKKPQTRQIGTNCVQKVQQSPPIVNQQAALNEVKVNNQCAPVTVGPGQPTADGQTRSLQDKLTIYLNNIDKQSQKIKQQKAQLDRNQKTIQDCNRALGQKQSIIRNYGRDCKNLEKDLNENKKVRKQLQVLLQNANLCLTSLNLQKLSSKYTKFEP